MVAGVVWRCAVLSQRDTHAQDQTSNLQMGIIGGQGESRCSRRDRYSGYESVRRKGARLQGALPLSRLPCNRVNRSLVSRGLDR